MMHWRDPLDATVVKAEAPGPDVCDAHTTGRGDDTCDVASKMSSVAVNGVQAAYEYNYLGQQVVRRLTQAGQTIHSVHDAAGQRVAEYLFDAAAGTSSLIREYIWANGTLVGVYENGQMYYVRTDHIGRPVFATDSTGVVVWEASYLPFGGIQASSGPNLDLRFPGQWFQSESGLHQNWMRDYDPTTGRYLQADPLGLVDGASLYGYALQNPGRYVDPRGEFIGVFVKALGGAAGSALVQFGVNTVYGGTTGEQALGCINIISLGTGAAFGVNGIGVLGLLIKKRFKDAGISGAISTNFNSSVPPVYINEGECGCDLTNLPAWVKFLKNLALI